MGDLRFKTLTSLFDGGDIMDGQSEILEKSHRVVFVLKGERNVIVLVCSQNITAVPSLKSKIIIAL